MNKTKQHWTTYLLVGLLVFLLTSTAGLLSTHFVTQLAALQHAPSINAIIGQVILLLSNISLIIFMLLLCYILFAYLEDLPVPFRKQLALLTGIPNLRQAFNFRASIRNSYIMLLALPACFYGLVMQRSVSVTLGIALLPLLLLYAIHFKSNKQNGLLTTICLVLLLVFCMLRLRSFQNYSLLNSLSASGIGLSISFALAILLAIRYRKLAKSFHRKTPKTSILLPFLSLSTLLIAVYTICILTVVNCHYAPPGVDNYKAHVVRKCPITTLQLSYIENGKKQYAAIDVHPKLFHRVEAGDNIQLHLHRGRLGWSWYHDDISKRYYD